MGTARSAEHGSSQPASRARLRGLACCVAQPAAAVAVPSRSTRSRPRVFRGMARFSCWPKRSARSLRAAGARAPETAQAESPQNPGRLACSHVLCGLAARQAHEHGCHRDGAGRFTHAPRTHCRPAVLRIVVLGSRGHRRNCQELRPAHSAAALQCRAIRTRTCERPRVTPRVGAPAPGGWQQQEPRTRSRTRVLSQQSPRLYSPPL